MAAFFDQDDMLKKTNSVVQDIACLKFLGLPFRCSGVFF